MRFTHIWREGNQGEDAMAKMGRDGLNFLRTWENAPAEILQLLCDDCMGSVYVRT